MLTHFHSSPLTLSSEQRSRPPPFTADGGTKTGGGLKRTPDGGLSSVRLPHPDQSRAAAAGTPVIQINLPPKKNPTKSLRLVKPTKASPGIWDQLAKHTQGETHKRGKINPVCPARNKTSDGTLDKRLSGDGSFMCYLYMTPAIASKTYNWLLTENKAKLVFLCRDFH